MADLPFVGVGLMTRATTLASSEIASARR